MAAVQRIRSLARANAAEAVGDVDGMYALLNRAIDDREPMIIPFLLVRRHDLGSDSRFQQLLIRTVEHGSDRARCQGPAAPTDAGAPRLIARSFDALGGYAE